MFHLLVIEFIKKNYEKVALSVALLILTVMVALFAVKIDSLVKEFGESTRRTPKGQTVEPMDLAGYSNTIEQLSQPFLWTRLERDPFRRLELVTQTDGDDVPITRLPRLVRVVREPFKLLFKAYSFDAEKGTGYNFQINFRDFRKTFFIPALGDYVKDPWENTGYRITKFTHKTITVTDPKIAGQIVKDISELTLEHDREKPIVLVWGQEAEQQEPVAWADCLGATLYLRRDQRFRCGGVNYKVVDINPTQMVIVDVQSGEEHILRLGSSE